MKKSESSGGKFVFKRVAGIGIKDMIIDLHVYIEFKIPILSFW